MNKPCILIIDEVHPIVFELFDAHNIGYDYNPKLKREELLAIIENYEGIILRSKIKADKEVIDCGKKLKIIGRTGSGMETIDIDYAQSKGITCLNSPEGNRDAVAEHVIGMLLTLINNINKADKEVRAKIWDREGNRGMEMKGKTFGIIGFGNIGSVLAKKLSGFEMNILAYDKYKTGFSTDYVKETNFETLVKQSDFISFHVPQTPETIYMANEQFFENCKTGVIVINSSRGKVLKTEALVQALEQNKISGAALDVLEYESFDFRDFLTDEMPPAFNYIVNHPKVVFTPHVAGWTIESKYKLSEVMAQKIISTLQK
ncbi:MAG: NAD(P)-dependent oxidoreductase [Bacteroidales bacterium]